MTAQAQLSIILVRLQTGLLDEVAGAGVVQEGTAGGGGGVSPRHPLVHRLWSTPGVPRCWGPCHGSS